MCDFADLKQTIMRFGGFTANVRRENGFTDGVMFLGVQEDLLLFLQYYDLQKAALAKGDDWMSAEYPQRFGPVVQSARKHAKKSLRLDEHLAMTVQKGVSIEQILLLFLSLSAPIQEATCLCRSCRTRSRQISRNSVCHPKDCPGHR